MLKLLTTLAAFIGPVGKLLGGRASKESAGLLSGALNGAGIIVAAVALIWYMLGNRDMVITLNLLELSGIVLMVVTALEFQRRNPPPGAP